MEIPETQRHYLKSQNVLCVEDDGIVLKIAADILKCFYNHVYEAIDGQEAWDIYQAHEPAYIFTDISMPKSSGIEFVSKVRKHNPDVCIIFMTGNTDKKTLLDVIDVAPNAFLEKPFTADDLVQTLIKVSSKSTESQQTQIDQNTYLDMQNVSVIRNGKSENLTLKELRLLELLIRHKNTLVTYSQIETYVWEEEGMTESSLKSLIYRLRTKVCKKCIKSVSGLGLRLEI